MDMLGCAREATELVAGRARHDLDRDRVLSLALQRLVEVIGEAATRVSPMGRAAYPQLPWRLMTGMRNRLIHGYDIVDPAVLWDTITLDLPDLIGHVETILAGEVANTGDAQIS
jgi:uncharacterized protein with HEPN domain